jgi:uncharacterized membrane protein YozB (DUF420 family)
MFEILLLNQINLALQATTLVIFAIGIAWKVQGRTMWHAKAMLLAFLINVAALLFLMIPLFLQGLPIVSAAQDNLSMLYLSHHFVGAMAFLLSLFLITRFARGRFTDRYCRGRWLMLTTAALWAAALLLGFTLYLYGYFPG